MVGKSEGIDRMTVFATASSQSPTPMPQPMELMEVSWSQSSMWGGNGGGAANGSQVPQHAARTRALQPAGLSHPIQGPPHQVRVGCQPHSGSLRHKKPKQKIGKGSHRETYSPSGRAGSRRAIHKEPQTLLCPPTHFSSALTAPKP